MLRFLHSCTLPNTDHHSYWWIVIRTRSYRHWTIKKVVMTRKRKHIREIEKYLEMLMLDQVNLSIYASRFGWSEQLQNQLVNTALLIRKYQRRLRLIKM